MNDEPAAEAARFKLTIELDTDGIEWTHLKSTLGHVQLPRELPTPLWKRLTPIVHTLACQGVRKVLLEPEYLPKLRVNGVLMDMIPTLGTVAYETLILTAWWMEWYQRKNVSRDRIWSCPECQGQVTQKPGAHCQNPDCLSWDLLHMIRKDPELHLVPSRNRTGTDHR